MRFKEVHVPLRFYLSYCKTNFPRGCFVAPSFIRHLVTCQSVSYVSASSSCKNGQYLMFWLESEARILFIEFLQFLFYFILYLIKFAQSLLNFISFFRGTTIKSFAYFSAWHRSMSASTLEKNVPTSRTIELVELQKENNIKMIYLLLALNILVLL